MLEDEFSLSSLVIVLLEHFCLLILVIQCLSLFGLS
jgi:hypothetical protein